MTNHNSSANGTLWAPDRHRAGQPTWQEQQHAAEELEATAGHHYPSTGARP